MEEITNEIYTGAKTTKEDVAYHKIKYIINVSGVPTEYKCNDIYPIADDGVGNTPEQFINILEAIDRGIKEKGTPIFIQCHAGMSRSPVVAALYLYYNGTFRSFDDALAYVEEKNKIARLNWDLIDYIKRNVIPLIKE